MVINNKKYVGSSKNIYKRYIEHKKSLIEKRHQNKRCQKEFDKTNSMDFSVLELTTDLLNREKFWIDYLRAGLNLVRDPRINRIEKTGLKKVYQFDLKGNFIKKWDSVLQAIDETKIKTIYESVTGKSKSSGGFLWSYKKKVNPYKPKESKKIKTYVYDLEGNYLSEYESMVECYKSLFFKENEDLVLQRIFQIIRGKSSSYKNYRFFDKKVDKLDNTKLLSIEQHYIICQLDKNTLQTIKLWNNTQEIAKTLNLDIRKLMWSIRNKTTYFDYKWKKLGL